jgi:AraC-like DNA-binding protein
MLTGLPKAIGSPRELAKLIGEDLSSLNRKIRNESGLNLGTLLDERRLELSYAGLKTKELPISQIAWDAGFQDPNYFTRWFKKRVGQTPKQWQAGATIS